MKLQISSVVLGLPNQSLEDAHGLNVPQSDKGDNIFIPPVDFSLIEIIKTFLSCQIPHITLGHLQGVVNENQTDPSHETPLSYSLGAGLTCDVYRHQLTAAQCKSLEDKSWKPGVSVALRRLKLDPTIDRASYHKFTRRAARMLRQELLVWSHPLLKHHVNINGVIFIGWENSLLPVLASELAHFGTLEDFWTSALGNTKGSSITTWERLRAMVDIGQGLQALHACGLSHGDVKPQNVLAYRDSQWGVSFKLTDFSGAKPDQPADGDYTFENIATPPWMAPEVLSNSKIQTWSACDVYSYGLLIVTLWNPACVHFDRPSGARLECFLSLYHSDIPDKDHGFLWMKKLEDSCEESALSRALGMDIWCLSQEIAQKTLRRDPTERDTMLKIMESLALEFGLGDWCTQIPLYVETRRLGSSFTDTLSRGRNLSHLLWVTKDAP